MDIVIFILTGVMVLDCLFLILLVLIQLPKKEAGAGMAFGGGATDALFGAGSGTALTQITKYAAGLFLALALVLSILNTHKNKSSRSRIQEELSKKGAAPSLNLPATTGPKTNNSAAPAMTPQVVSNLLTATRTNAAVATSNQAPAAPIAVTNAPATKK